MCIGKRISKLRVEQNMTLEELGNKVGVGKSTVKKWESGAIENMRRDKIGKLAAALNVSPAELMGWDEPISLEPDEMQTERLAHYYVNTETARLADEIKDNPDLKVLFDASKNLTPENIKFVIEMINKMKGDD